MASVKSQENKWTVKTDAGPALFILYLFAPELAGFPFGKMGQKVFWFALLF